MRIEAIIPNHNTSAYAELALRSLSYFNYGIEGLSVTVMDNHSVDDVEPLKQAAHALGAAFETSRWPVATRSVNSHGDVLRDFVLSRPDCDAYLFVDADIYFTSHGAVATMIRELSEAPEDVWAVQAGFSWDGQEHFHGSLFNQRKPDLLHIAFFRAEHGRRPTREELLEANFRVHSGTFVPRAHPACLLIRKTELLQTVARQLGFGTAWLWSEDKNLGGFCDTMALASQVMEISGKRFLLSSASVAHFFNVSYWPDADKESHCRAKLEELRRAQTQGEPAVEDFHRIPGSIGSSANGGGARHSLLSRLRLRRR